MGCKRLDTDFFNFLEVVHSEKSDRGEKKRVNYYPFGLQHKGYNNTVSANVNSVANRFGYGGKELGDELNLNWYDVSARNYDPALARWMNIDPLAEKMRRHSPYNFGFDNPVYFQDYDGKSPTGPGNPIKQIIKKAVKKIGRLGKQKRLRELANDTKQSSANRGWIKNEIRHIKNKNRKTIRNPRNSRNSKSSGGTQLVHKRGKEADKGFDYSETQFNDSDLHKLQHKYDDKGRKNKLGAIKESATAAGAASTISNEEVDTATDNSNNTAQNSQSLTGNETMDSVFEFSKNYTETMDNFGKKIFGDNILGNTIDDFVNPFPGFSELFSIVEQED